MQEKIAILSGFLLGLVFVVFGLNFFFHFLPVPSPEEGSAAAAFMGAAYSSGLLTAVKLIEIIGGICVALPRSRNLGLLLLGPIVVNILLYQLLLVGGSLFAPPCYWLFYFPFISYGSSAPRLRNSPLRNNTLQNYVSLADAL